MIYLIGYGPGDPELLTVKAHRILREVEIIFYDDLVDSEFISTFNIPSIYVGKRKGKHSSTQEEINEQLFQATFQYQKIARLKGGDPFIFGRGGEELHYLLQKGIQVEIIPGVTAASAAAASAYIPLTHRGISKTLSFIPAHHLGVEPLNLPKDGTLAIYMGASKLEELKLELLKQGHPAHLPVAIIQNASRPQQKIDWTNIENMPKSTLASPLVILIGEVVGFAKGNLRHE